MSWKGTKRQRLVESVWFKSFDERQQRLILNCMDYAESDPAGLPGHNLMLIVARMVEVLDYRVEYVPPQENNPVEWQNIPVPGPPVDVRLDEENVVWCKVGNIWYRTENFFEVRPDWVEETDPETLRELGD